MTKEQYERLQKAKKDMSSAHTKTEWEVLALIILMLGTLVDIALKEYERKLP